MSNATTSKKVGYLVLSAINPNMVLCTDGQFHAKSQVGPGGWCGKVYKTEAGARKHNPMDLVQPCTE